MLTSFLREISRLQVNKHRSHDYWDPAFVSGTHFVLRRPGTTTSQPRVVVPTLMMLSMASMPGGHTGLDRSAGIVVRKYHNILNTEYLGAIIKITLV